VETLFLQAVLNGITNGCILALMALGLALIFGTFRVPNFGHGGFFTWGAFITYFLVMQYGLDIFSAIVLSMLFTAMLGVAAEKSVFKPLRKTSEDVIFVAATGLLIAFTNAALLLWGDWPRSITHPFRDSILRFGTLTIPVFRVIIISVVLSTYFILYLMLKRTTIGKTIRAIAQDTTTARLLGVNPDRVASFTFAVGTALAGLAGSLTGMEFTVSFDMGILPTIKSFIIIVVGGIGSIVGTLVTGIFLGVIDSLTITYLTSAYNNVVAFLLLIVFLLLRPQGILGKEVRRA